MSFIPVSDSHAPTTDAISSSISSAVALAACEEFPETYLYTYPQEKRHRCERGTTYIHTILSFTLQAARPGNEEEEKKKKRP